MNSNTSNPAILRNGLVEIVHSEPGSLPDGAVAVVVVLEPVQLVHHAPWDQQSGLLAVPWLIMVN